MGHKNPEVQNNFKMTDDESEPERLELLEALLQALDESEDISCLLDSPLVDALLSSLDDDIGDISNAVQFQLISTKILVLLKLLKFKGPPPQVSTESFQSCLHALFIQMDQSLAKDMAYIRNDLAVILLIVAKERQELCKEFGSYGMQIATLLYENVLGMECPMFPLHSRPEDIEFLKIFIHLTNLVVIGHPRNLYIAENCCLLETAMTLCIGPCQLLDTLAADEGILHGSWELLETLSRLCPTAFAQKQVVGAMLEYLKIYVTSAAVGCKGKVNPKIMTIFIQTLRTLVRERVIQDFLIEENGVPILVGVLEEMTRSDWDCSLDFLLANLLLTIASICNQNDTQQTLFFEGNGVKILLRLLNRFIYAPPEKLHKDPMLGICLGECIWRTLTSSASSLETWLGFEGMFRLLDFLEQNESRGCQLTLLNAILDLCEYPRCLDQVLYWKRRRPQIGDKSHVSLTSIGEDVGIRIQGQDISLASLLCELWRQEEAFLKVDRKEGLIANLENPVLSAYGRESKFEYRTSIDLACSLRPKIYLLAKKITEATNTEAALFGGLGVENQVTMELIINFMDLKRAELWLEMVESLQGVPLVDSDAAALDRYARIAKNKSLTVLDTQQFLLCRDHEQKLTQERQLHLKIRQATLQGHLTSIQEAEERARTSNYQLLADKRLWQKTQLTMARREYGPFIPEEARMHLTTNQNLNLTSWDGRTKIVDSEEAGFQEDAVTVQEVGETAGEDSTMDDSDIKSLAQIPHPPIYVTEVTRSVDESPSLSPVEGFYEVNPQALSKALSAALNKEKKWNWKTGEEAWSLRTKWKSSWYH